MRGRKQSLLNSFEAGDLYEVEFVELALDAGFSIPEIEKALADHRVSSPFEKETMQ